MKKGKILEAVTHTHTHTHRKEKGITLIALIITVILLLILVGVAINFALGENGILRGAEYAVDKYQNKAEQEQNELAKIDDYIKGNREDIPKSKILFEGNQSTGTITFENDKISNYDSFEFMFGILGTKPGERRLLTQTVSRDFLELQPFEEGDVKYITASGGSGGVIAILIDNIEENSIDFRVIASGTSWSKYTGEIYKIIGRKN